jgi:peptide/nickel transport system ATP-binding protein
MNKPSSTLEVQGLTLGYRRHQKRSRVIADVSFHIRHGEAYGLVGESGCGKTTVAMAIMRYLPPNAEITAGRLLFQGEDLLSANASRLRQLRGNRMAMVYQDPGSALNPSLTVGHQIAEVYRFHRQMHQAAAIEAAEAMLRTVQIADAGRVARRYPHELSGGQQQRIMFAMALATEPDLLVLDEPTTGLDATVEAEVLDLVEELRAKYGASILFISHNLGIVSRMCERVGVLYAGYLVEEGPSGAVFRTPRHPYTRGLTRCIPRTGMNKRRDRLDPIPGTLPLPGELPSGCVYAPRCPISRAHCREAAPDLLPAGPARTSRCFYHQEVAVPMSSAALRSAGPHVDANEEMLTVSELTKTFPAHGAKVTAVKDASLSVAHGEVLGIVGESGSGKSTLAKCILGLVDGWSGRIDFDGASLAGKAERRDMDVRQRLQMVFQNPDTTLNPSHTVRRILRRAVRLLSGTTSMAAIDRRVAELTESVRLAPHHLELRPSALSGGLKQRVALARAFAGSPRLVVCDEPTSALDVSVQAAILNLLAELQDTRHISYIFISHDLGVVRYLSDRIAVMYLGQIIELGLAELTFRPPHHPYTEALLSSMPDVHQVDANRRIQLQGEIPSPSQPPAGCRFHTRCPRMLGAICQSQEPPWQHDGSQHVYRCHIAPAELAALQTIGFSEVPKGEAKQA